ncbi:MAG: hypothetical protein IBX48_09325, partial [Thiomicrospira sp.]|uniref:hypothetical protein n=1 Tax=Thiomicrospira sp. TaxID=935 RepID=UPI001A069344
MLNTAPDTRSVSPLFGFINRPETPQLAISQPGIESPSLFSVQLGALMMAEYKKGNLDLAALSDLKQVDPQSLQAFADSLSFDVDQASDESMFQQLSAWLAQQGLATAFTDSSVNTENSEAGLSLEGLPPGLVENSVLAGAGDSEVVRQTLTQFDELTAELKASVQAMLEALKTDKTSEQKHLAIAEFTQALQKMTVLLKEENTSAKFNVNFEDSQSLTAKFENDADADASPLLTDFIQNHLLPYAQKLDDGLSEDQADLAALNLANLSPNDAESDGFSVLDTLEALTALLSSESLSIEDLSDDDLVRLEDIVGFVQTLQMQTPAGNDVTHAKPSGAPVEGAVDADLELATGEEAADLLLNQTSMAIPLSPQATQQAAPQGLAGMAQAAINRQVPPNNANANANANGVAGQAQTQ